MKQSFLELRHEIVVDNFAGGGGASTGIRAALGRECNIAVNHDHDAIFVHTANHPETEHFQEDVYAIDINAATRGQPVGLAWFSPDCKHFSKAKGGKPVSKKIRGLAWVAVKWARVAAPRVIMLENVEEFKDWGPLRKDGMPCKKRKGITFKRWVGCLRTAGYTVDWKEMRACDYGAPTIRKRLFVVARRDGRPIVWPEPTHGKTKGLIPYRTAADCIDWGIPCPSIFTRKRPLKPATMRRIATGIMRYVVNCADPFIVPLTHSGDDRVHDINEPLRTQTCANRGEFALVEPFLINTRNGERAGQEPRTRSKDEPYFTVTAKGSQGALIAPVIVGVGGRAGQSRPRTPGEPYQTITAKGDAAVVAAFLAQHNSDRKGRPRAGRSMKEPVSTLTAIPKQQQVVTAFMEQANTDMVGHDMRKPVSTIVGKGCTQRVVTSNLVKLRGTASAGQPVDEPLHTITTNGKGGGHFAEVRAFLINYYSSGSGKTGSSMKKPAPSVTAKARFGLVTIKGVDYQIVDIGMRMLAPHELFAAQGFPKDYKIAPARDGKPLTKTAQIRLCGNSVCPPVAEALVRANFKHESRYEAVAQ